MTARCPECDRSLDLPHEGACKLGKAVTLRNDLAKFHGMHGRLREEAARVPSVQCQLGLMQVELCGLISLATALVLDLSKGVEPPEPLPEGHDEPEELHTFTHHARPRTCGKMAAANDDS